MIVRPAAASHAIRALLTGPARPARVLAAFPRAVYLEVGDELLAVVTRDGVHQPNGLVLAADADARPLAGLHRTSRVVVGAGRVSLPDGEIRPTRWWDPRPRLATTPAVLLAARTRRLDATVRLRAAAPFPRSLRDALRRVASAVAGHDVDEGVRHAGRLLGAGPGLTPAGDDALAGLLAGVEVLAPALDPLPGAVSASRALGVALAEAAPQRTTAVSAALLRCAARGEVARPAADVLRALTGQGDLEAATGRLLEVGSTSGRDLAVGLVAAGELVTATVPTTGPAAPDPPVATVSAGAVPDARPVRWIHAVRGGPSAATPIPFRRSR